MGDLGNLLLFSIFLSMAFAAVKDRHPLHSEFDPTILFPVMSELATAGGNPRNVLQKLSTLQSETGDTLDEQLDVQEDSQSINSFGYPERDVIAEYSEKNAASADKPNGHHENIALKDTAEQRSDCQTNSGSPCLFPFNYKGTKYTKCTLVGNDNVPWCSTMVDSDENYIDGHWGNCSPGCPGVSEEWSVIAEKTECDGSEAWKGRQYTVDQCASQCKGVSSLFIFGTNDYSDNRCFDNGCDCYCETSARSDGTCPRIAHNGFRLYKFGIPTAKECTKNDGSQGDCTPQGTCTSGAHVCHKDGTCILRGISTRAWHGNIAKCFLPCNRWKKCKESCNNECGNAAGCTCN